MRHYCAALVAIALLAAGCGTADEAGPAAVAGARALNSPSQSASTEPVGLIAIGHSGLTGESSDPARLGAEAKDNSWATGTSEAVNSVYLRMLRVRPQTEGHVANTAKGGAKAFNLASQAAQALKVVPNPELVIIQSLDNDIRCDGSDALNVSTYGSQVADALALVREASPAAKILIVGQIGRPATAAPAIAKSPSAKIGVTGTGPCDFFDPTGKLVPSKIQFLTKVIEGYEAEQAKACAASPPCRTDEGALAAFVDDPAEIVAGHFTTKGIARVAATIWPTVEDFLGKP